MAKGYVGVGGASREDVLERVLALCRLYYTQYRAPVPLRVLSQKWNKVTARLGFDLREALLADPRFTVNLSKSAAFQVYATSDLSLGSVILATLKQRGGEASVAQLKEAALGAGKPVETFEADLNLLLKAGTLARDGDTVYALTSLE